MTIQKKKCLHCERSLFKGKIELRDASLPLTGSDIFKQVKGLNVTFGKPIEIPNTSKRGRGTNVEFVGAEQWKKRSIFFYLPY